MKYTFFALCVAVFAGGCVTSGDLRNSQAQLQKAASERKVYSSVHEAAKEMTAKCEAPVGSDWQIELTDHDPLIKQDTKGTVGYFKVLCFASTGGRRQLEVTGVHAGGGMGGAFYLLPKITLIDPSGRSTEEKLISLKQNAWSGNLETTIDLGELKHGRYLMLVEGDNRAGTNNIGRYIQNSYGSGVAVSASVEMYALPTGKARISLK